MKVNRIGIDLAKNVFEIHGVDSRDRVVLRETLKRDQVSPFFARLEPCTVAMEACGSSHHWARTIRDLGHEVLLIAAQFVGPYRKSSKNDRNDAEAICEAAGRPSMRFVPIKDVEQQSVLVLHRIRERAVGERTALANQTRGLLAEFGIIVGQGINRLRQAIPDILEDGDNGLPLLARQLFADLYVQLQRADEQVAEYDRRIRELAKTLPQAKRLMTIPGVGPLIATAIVASVGDARLFNSGRQFAAWLGLVPRQYSSGGKTRQGRITKRGDVYLRKLLVHGARSVMVRLKGKTDAVSQWASQLKQRRGFNKATVALAAKNARIIWAVWVGEADYRTRAAVA